MQAGELDTVHMPFEKDMDGQFDCDQQMATSPSTFFNLREIYSSDRSPSTVCPAESLP
jgi:hypothetical protein